MSLANLYGEAGTVSDKCQSYMYFMLKYSLNLLAIHNECNFISTYPVHFHFSGHDQAPRGKRMGIGQARHEDERFGRIQKTYTVYYKVYFNRVTVRVFAQKSRNFQNSTRLRTRGHPNVLQTVCYTRARDECRHGSWHGSCKPCLYPCNLAAARFFVFLGLKRIKPEESRLSQGDIRPRDTWRSRFKRAIAIGVGFNQFWIEISAITGVIMLSLFFHCFLSKSIGSLALMMN